MSTADAPGLDELIARAPTDPAAAAALRQHARAPVALVALDIHPAAHHGDDADLVEVLTALRAADAAIRPSVAEHGGRVLQRVTHTLLARFPDPRSALLAALDARRRIVDGPPGRADSDGSGPTPDRIHVSIGLDLGPTLIVPGEGPLGRAVDRALALAREAAGCGAVRATTGFWRATGTPPAGVGGFAAPEARCEAVGFPFVVVSDYRS
ncbi:MAG: hypothetical protein D6798_15750 [Deltaproteobacteria bacterium]|nr:MAG: hypothetical protein D6798_15750 [Deltaproteobacteria bacterium]